MDKIEALTLLNLPGVGRRTAHKVLAALNGFSFSDENIRKSFEEIRKCYSAVKIPTTQEIKAARDRAEDLYERCRRLAIKILFCGEENFPLPLREIPDSPLLLFVRGDTAALFEDKGVAIIGTREPSPFGIRAATKLGAIFAQQEWAVISGLAKGCDTAAHHGCLERDGKTVAFLAHGLDIVYPPENRDLAARILKKGGCLVSEYPPGVRPEKHHFMERDRIQSGLALGVLVVETDLASGTMHTVHYALSQKKPLACLRHPKRYQSLPQIEGNKHLLASGKAAPLSSRAELEAFIARMAVRQSG